MYPNINIGFPLHLFGIMVMLGFLAGSHIIIYRLKKELMDEDIAYDIVIWAMIGGILGARLYHVIQFWEINGYNENFLEAFKVWKGGLVLYGGVIGGALAVYILIKKYQKKTGWSYMDLADIVVPALAVGIGFGRLGCFFNGCCYGKPVSDGFFLGLVFPDKAPVYNTLVAGTAVHPTQLYSAIAGFTLFGLLLLLYRFFPKKGQLMCLFLCSYSAFRFSVEFFRSDSPLYTHFGYPLRAGQEMSVIAFLTFLSLFFLITFKGVKKRTYSFLSTDEQEKHRIEFEKFVKIKANQSK